MCSLPRLFPRVYQLLQSSIAPYMPLFDRLAARGTHLLRSRGLGLAVAPDTLSSQLILSVIKQLTLEQKEWPH